MNKHISFETSKLLKEKGYNEPCGMLYNDNGILSGTKMSMGGYPNNYMNKYSAPTIVDVVMWLYEKYGIWITVDNLIDNKFYFSCRNIKTRNYASRTGCNEDGYNTSTEAYEAAIIYTLNNLI